MSESSEFSRIVDTQQEQQERRVSVNRLAIQLLQLKNPHQTKESISERFNANTEVYTKPFAEAYRDARSEARGGIEGLEDAVGIVRFYMDNPKLLVPTKVVMVNNSVKNPELTDDPDEKVLVYLQEERSKYERERRSATSYTFSDTRKVGFLRTEAPQERPDVFIEHLNSKNPSFVLTGAENVLIGTSILSYSQYDVNKSVAIHATGKVALLPSVFMTGGGYSGDKSRKIVVQTEGDFIQYPESRLAVQELNCHDFIQKGGDIVAPSPDVSSIECNGEFIPEGGTIAEEPHVKIRDKRFYESGAMSSVQERILASEAGIVASEDIVEPTTEVEKAEVTPEPETEKSFEAYEVTKEGTRPDGTSIRAYNLGFIEPDDYANFAFGAEMEGWTISSATEVSGQMCVTVRKPSQPEE